MYLAQDTQDAAVVRDVLGGDVDAFEVLVRRHQRVLFTVALRMLGDRDEASDAVQNALVKAYEKLNTFDDRYRFFSWLYRIVVNECLNVRRARRPLEPVTAEIAGTTEPVDALEVEERRKRVQTAVLALPVDYRQVVVLRHFTELSYEEISATVGVPVKTVKSRLYTARQRLAHLLDGFGNDA